MDTKKYYVYRHYIEGNTFYVGKGNKGRMYEKRRNKIWDKIVNSNNGNYEIEIVEYFNDEKEAYKFERELTEYYKSINQCEANIMIGKGCLLGSNNGMYGKVHSKETRNKISKANTGRFVGRKLTEETKIKLSLANKGKKRSQEVRDKISRNHADFSGCNHPNYGNNLSYETKKKISKSLTKYNNLFIIIKEEKIEFENSKDCAKFLKENIFKEKSLSGIERSIRDSIRLNKKLYNTITIYK